MDGTKSLEQRDCNFKICPKCSEKCRYWIDFEKDENCSLKSIKKNGKMSLRETAERLGISYVRVQQLEQQALKKIKKISKNRKELLNE